MKLIVPTNMYISTTDGFIQAKQLAEDPEFIVKGYMIDKHPKYDTYYVSRISYSKIKSQLVKPDEPYDIFGYKIFHGNIFFNDVDNKAYVYALPGMFLPIERLNEETEFITIIKNMVVDVKVNKRTYTKQKEYVELEIIDLPSILLSYDELGTVTMLLFKISSKEVNLS